MRILWFSIHAARTRTDRSVAFGGWQIATSFVLAITGNLDFLTFYYIINKMVLAFPSEMEIFYLTF